MTSQFTTNFRLVRCGRCRQLLPEFENIPVYQCGGCGTILQAKNHKNGTKGTVSHIPETDAAQKTESEHASEKKEAGSLSHEETLASTEELPLEKNSLSDQNGIKDSNREESGDTKFSSELSSEPAHHGNEESSPGAMAETEVDQHLCSLEQNNGGDQNERGYCNRSQPGGVNFPDADASSTELIHHESEESSPVAGARSEVDENRNCLEQNNGGDRSEHGDCNGKHPGGVNFSDEVALSADLIHHESEESSLVAGAHGEVDENRNCLEQNNGGDRSEHGDCNGKHPGGVNFSDEVASSADLIHHESEESSPVAGAHGEVDENRNCLEQNNGGDRSEHGDCNGKQPGGVNFYNEVASSAELNHHESEESSLVAGAHSEVDENRNCLEQNVAQNQNEHGYCNGKHLGGLNFSNEVALSTEFNHHESEESSPVAGAHAEVDENRNCLEENYGRNRSEFGDCKREWPGHIKFSNEAASSTELTCQEIEESSPEVGTNIDFDENFKSPIFGGLSVENLLAACPRDSIIADQRLSCESILTDNLMSPHSEQLKHPQKRVLGSFDRESSIESLEDIALANSSEFSITRRDMRKSPMTNSNYAYDGSVSSFDGTDDQIPDQHPHLSKRKFKEAVSLGTKALPRRDEVTKKITSTYPKVQHQAWNHSSISSERKHHAMKGSKWHRDELLEPTRHGHPVRSRMKNEMDEPLPRVPFYSRGSPVGYENGGPSNYGQNEFQCSTSSHLPKKPEYPEDEKMELLKMVYELRDQLNKTRISKGKANERSPGVAGMQKPVPSYYDHMVPEVEICRDLRYARYPRRCNQGKNWQTRVPFSAEATVGRHQADHSCLHCCPQDWKCSAPLSPHICCTNNQYTAHPSPRYYNLYCSSPSSPQHCTGSMFSLRSCDEQSDDHWHKNHEAKKYSRERRQLVKKHVRPVAGGSPFLVCYRCSELLQLPADFLIFRRRCHQLRCSACSVILKFSLQNGTHIVPYTDYAPDAKAPPPSEVDGCSDANNGRKLASVSYASNCPHADPVSCSDDYGLSLCVSCSTEGEPFSVGIPVHALKRGSNDRKTSSGSSFEPIKERKKRPIFKESQNKYKNPLVTSARPPSRMPKAEKLSSEIEELPPRGTSPLHKLMGYSSPSAVIDI